ncbi:MAG TPA: serine hydrolase domain-containing protein [Rhizomicrobium sp.]|nr:serine hydrolase domain-containing protein [Rhizomicrobium sp.]
MNEVSGTVEKGYEAVREGFAAGQIADEGGAQLCVYRNGRKVVDLWTGRDKINNRPYTDKTLTVLMSCSKGAMATAAHMLAERGQLDLDAPVTRYWPEFGKGGKQNVPVSYLLSHRVGLTSFEPQSGIGAKELLNWEMCTDALEAMEPLWEPGTSNMYHAVTYGYLVGEVIRRVCGKSPGKFLADEIARPLGLDLWIGLPESEESRVAPHFTDRPTMTLEQWKGLLAGFNIDVNSRVAQTMMHMLISTDEAIEIINTRQGHAAEIPAANMIGNARSLAKMYAATIGEVDGVRLLKRETMERARKPQTDGLKGPGDFARLPNPDPQRLALGYELNRRTEPMLGDGSFGHAGAGGRLGFAHPESGFAVGYCCNNMLWDGIRGPDDRWIPWTKALNDIIAAKA